MIVHAKEILMALEMGTLLKDRFRLLRPLGEGGMGEVYLGEDERGGAAEGRPVAIKALRTELNEKHDLFLRRFREEIDILKRLNQPGVPAFVDAFEEGSRSFFVMEYVEGHSLESLLDLSPLGLRPDMVAEVGIQVLKILEALHGQSPPLIHRDIKPANMIIRKQDESVFLVDFGLAREFHTEAAARTLVGTVGYCPLEQLQGHPEPRSDLYALGATLFELLTGQIPKPLSIPPVRSVQPDVPEALAQLVDRSVSQKLEDRFPDAASMLKALEEVRRQIGPFSSRHAKKKTPSGDRADHLLNTWGKTQVQEVEVTGSWLSWESWKDWRPRKRLLPAALGILALCTMYCGYSYRGHLRYQKAQQGLVKDGLRNGSPGPGWVLADAGGLFPADGLGLGEPNRDWDSSLRSGVLFQSSEPRPTQTMSFRIQRQKGTPHLIVFCQPWGVLIKPARKNYELSLVKVDPKISLDRAPCTEIKGLQPVALSNLDWVEVRVSISGRSGQIYVDHRPKRKFAVNESWKSKRSGVILLNAMQQARCLVRDFQLR